MRAVAIIAEVSGSSPAEVVARLKKEHQDLGVNVREDILPAAVFRLIASASGWPSFTPRPTRSYMRFTAGTGIP